MDSISWTTVIYASPGWFIAVVTAAGLAGRGPVNLRKWALDRARKTLAHEQREQDLTGLAAIAPELRRMAEGYESIHKVIMGNGHGPLPEIVARVEQKLDAHIVSEDKVHEALYEQMAEQGHEIGAVERKLREVFNHRAPSTSPNPVPGDGG